MRIIYLFTALVFIAVFSAKSTSQETSTTANDSSAVNVFKPNINPSITISRCSNTSITIDGALNEPDWAGCQAATHFCEIEPNDNLKALVETEVKMLYDDNNLYFAFICYDNDMSRLRANMSDRDFIWDDDYVGAILDTYSDDKQGYEFFMNPFGIQGDALWTPTLENDSYDMLFSTGAKIYKDKWIVEVAVPFKSIRFPNKNVQQWKVHFIRTRPRDARVQMSWSHVSKDNNSLMGQAGFINGINGIKAGNNLEILPYVIGGITGYLTDSKDPDSKFKADSIIKGDFGVGLKYGFTSNLTGELVYNPDFSQVESDAAQVDVNSSSALFYDEKRPFFLESSSTFSTFIDVVYTRMINKPYLASKLTGKVGDFELGYIGAYDKQPQFILPFDYGSSFKIFHDSLKLHSFANVIRLRKSLKGESYLGLIGTDREVWNKTSKGYNRVFGFDGSLNFWSNWYFNFQALGYDTKEMNDTALYRNPRRFGRNGEYTLSFDGESFRGIGAYIGIQRNTRHWNFGVEYNDAPPEMRRDVGFVSSNNLRAISTWQNWNIYPKKGFVLYYHPFFDAGIKYDYNGRIREQWAIPGIYFQFKNLMNAEIGGLAVNNEEYEKVYHSGVNRMWFNLNINTFNIARGGIFFEFGKYIVRFRNPSYIGKGFYTEAWLTLKPVNRLTLENNYTYEELSNESGEKLYTGYIFRNKTSFQFSKNLFLRLVTQYNSFSKRFDIDPLFSYKWNPFTIFYIGSTHDLAEYSANNQSRFVETTRQFFAKFQYLFRL